jgi:dimethylglycine dehydrogenase
MAGFSQGGGVGLALSNWMVDGDPGFDVWGMDVARFGDWATMAYTNAKVRENYSRRFRIRFPNEELPAARPLRTTPVYDAMLAQGAVMGDNWGLEQPLWFAPDGVEDVFSFRRSTDFDHVAAECAAVRGRVGLSETSSFAKYEITGAGAETWLSHMLANHMPAEGRIVLTPMLNENGKLIGDFTLTKAGPETFYLFGSGQAEKYHMRWFEAHLPEDGSVAIRPLGLSLLGLTVAGPKARDVLAKITDEDVSNTAFRFMDFRRMHLGTIPAMVGRISYTGDLGYEIWVAPEYQRPLFEKLMEAGEEHGIRPFGVRALMSLRLEKNFGTWAREFRPLYGPFAAGLGRFVDVTKNDFIGRDGAMAEKQNGPERRLVAMVVEAGDADVIGDEPIWHGGEVVGWVTSGGYAHHAGLSMAQGYVPAALADGGADGFEIEILGERHAARLQAEPVFDPGAARMRG